MRFLSPFRFSENFDRKIQCQEVTLFIIFYTLLLDNFLLTALVPIIPDYLLEKDKEKIEETLIRLNATVFDNGTSLQVVFKNRSNSRLKKNQTLNVVQEIFSLPLDTINENTRIGWLLSSRSIVQMIANFFVGSITNRVGYAIPVFVGCLVLMVSTSGPAAFGLFTLENFRETVFIVGETYVPLFVARSLQGLGSALTTTAGMGMIADKYPDDKARSRAMGIAMGGAAFGVCVGYPLGGVMYTYFGKLAPFLFIFCLAAVDAVLQMVVLRSTLHEQTTSRGYPLHLLLRDPYILVASGTIMLTTSAISTLEPTLPLWIMGTMHVKKWQLGMVFLPDSLGYLIGTNGFGVAARSIGRWICGFSCMIMIGLCLICVPFASAVTHLIMPQFGLGLAIGITDVAMMPLLALLVDTRHEAVYGGVYSIAQVSVCLAYSIGPSIAGHVVKSIGFQWLIRGVAILNIAYAPLCWVLRKPCRNEEKVAIVSERECAQKYTEDKDCDSSFSYQRLDEG